MKQNFLIIILFFSYTIYSQNPHLEGTINLDIEKGLITCAFKLSNIDKNSSYSILLNRGFNVKYFKLNNQALDAGRKPSYNSIEYDIYKPNSTETDLPLNSLENIELEYTGAFPVYNDNEITDSDDMGLIAIKNHILRATSQSNFIPELKDRNTNKQVSTFTYNISVISNSEETVYLNGSKSQKGKKLKFVSDKPFDFLIYAGKYKVNHQGNLYLLNSDLEDEYIAVLVKNVEMIS